MGYGSSSSLQDEFFSLGDKVKSAVTDSLKKCSALFGLGLHLYEENHQTVGEGFFGNNNAGALEEQGAELNGEGADGRSTRLTSRQLNAINIMRRRLEMTEQELRELSEKKYARVVEHLNKKDASDLIGELSKMIKEGKNEGRNG
jgi:hypothetical protein